MLVANTVLVVSHPPRRDGRITLLDQNPLGRFDQQSPVFCAIAAESSLRLHVRYSHRQAIDASLLINANEVFSIFQ